MAGRKDKLHDQYNVDSGYSICRRTMTCLRSSELVVFEIEEQLAYLLLAN